MKRRRGGTRGLGSLQFLNLPSHAFSSDEDNDEGLKLAMHENAEVAIDSEPLTPWNDKSKEEVIEISDSEDVVILFSSPNAQSSSRASQSNTLPAQSPKAQNMATNSNFFPVNPYRTVNLHILCDIPGKKSSRFQDHCANVPFYSLEKEFGRDTVFLFNNQAFKKFMTPEKLCAGAPAMEIHVVTEPQWRAIQLGEDEEHWQEIQPQSEESEKRFAVVLEGKEGEVKALVTSASLVSNLVKHYLTTMKLSPETRVIVKFDGDKVDLNSALGELDLEEDDKLEMHV